jgi:hypothetical protein
VNRKVKQFLVVTLVALGLGAVLFHGAKAVSNFFLKGKTRQFMTHIAEIARSIERYKTDMGVYPTAMTPKELERILGKKYHPDTFISPGIIAYYSDGMKYTLQFWPQGEGPYKRGGYGLLEIRSGRWFAWPSFVLQERVQSLNEFIHARPEGLQSNNQMQPTAEGGG